MNLHLGLRALALLAFVVASTVVIVKPDLIGGAKASLSPALNTVFVVGHSSKGDVVQAVVGVEADGRTGAVASTGLTVGPGGAELAAFGAESWQRRGESGAAPGRIDSAQVRGSRIQVSGRLVQTETAAGVAPAPSVAFSFDARCDRKDPTP